VGIDQRVQQPRREHRRRAAKDSDRVVVISADKGTSPPKVTRLWYAQKYCLAH
jgi:hypothetical protein